MTRNDREIEADERRLAELAGEIARTETELERIEHIDGRETFFGAGSHHDKPEAPAPG